MARNYASRYKGNYFDNLM